MITKPITNENLANCAQLFVEIFNEEPWNDEWNVEQAMVYIKEHTDPPNAFSFVVYEEDQMIALLLGHTLTYFNGKELYINEFGVRNELQGNGIGTKILNFLKEDAKNHGITHMSLFTDRGVPAESFYLKYGFKEIDRLVFYSYHFEANS